MKHSRRAEARLTKTVRRLERFRDEGRALFRKQVSYEDMSNYVGGPFRNAVASRVFYLTTAFVWRKNSKGERSASCFVYAVAKKDATPEEVALLRDIYVNYLHFKEVK